MTKQEIIEAINSTMVGNGIKGITAESLRLILTAIAENAGGGAAGGSGDGALRILMPDGMMGSTFFDAEGAPDGFVPGFTPTNWEIMSEEIEYMLSDIDNIFSDYSAEYRDMIRNMYERFLNMVPEMFAHNAEVYNILLEKIANEEGALLMLDESFFLTFSIKAFLLSLGQATGQETDISSIHVSSSTLGVLSGMGAGVLGEGEYYISFDRNSDNSISILGDLVGSPIKGPFILLPDGGITIEGDGGVTVDAEYVYIPYDSRNSRPSNDVVLSSNFMSHNANLVSSWNLDKIKNIEYIDSNGDGYTSTPRVLYSTHTPSEGIVEYWDGYQHKLYRSTISTDGSVNTTEVASISTTQVSE
jgi:hypothetical protein